MACHEIHPKNGIQKRFSYQWVQSGETNRAGEF
jgi:hypothetical protein